MSAKNRYYGVKIGRKPGIYTNWDECKEQIDGFSGALYMGFSTLKAAEDFVGLDDTLPISGKCYAVKKGNKPGIYATWDECKEQVSGYPNAEYRKCADYNEALAYIAG